MSFNTTTKSNKTNHENAKAYSISDELELYTLVATSNVSDKFYESADDSLSRLRELISNVKPEFVIQLAIYAREKMHLRSIPLVLLVELAKIYKGNNVLSKGLTRVIQRADELTEVLAYYQLANSRKDSKKLNKLSAQIKKGIKKAFNKFDEYQFAKYAKSKKAVTLRDALFLTHPAPLSPERQVLFDKIANQTLETPFTWEVEVSTKGNSKDVWESLIKSHKLGYMAMIRNLRNILNANIEPEHIKTVCEMLSDKNQVMKSKQLPFRFLSAYRELQNNASMYTPMVLEALENAVQQSIHNVKGFYFDTSVAIACDVSGSMQQNISPRSTVQNYDIGLILGMLMQSKCERVVTQIFGDTSKIIQLPRTSILQNVMELHRREGEVGYSTNGHLVLRELIDNNIKADKVLIFTDCQMWNSYQTADSFAKAWSDYQTFHPTSKLYLFDLSGYNNTPVKINNNNVHLISGWSDKVFDMLDAHENGSNALAEIKNIVI